MERVKLVDLDIVLSSPMMADRDQIVELLTSVYSAHPLNELAIFLKGSADSAALLDFNIERKLGVLARHGDEIVGLGGWRMSRGRPLSNEPVQAELVVLFVKPSFRRRGISESICRHFLRVCEQRKVPACVRIGVDQVAEGLLRKLGFVETSRNYQLTSNLPAETKKYTDS